MKENPLTRLIGVVDTLRVALPYDADTVARWQSCPLAELRERYTMKALHEEHYGLLSDALAKWRDRERRVLYLFGDSPEEFDSWFISERESLLQGRPIFGKHWYAVEQERLTFAAEASRTVLWNIWLAKSFGAYLPLSVPQSRAELATVGTRMAAIYFLECVAKMHDMSDSAKMSDMAYIGPKGLNVDFEDLAIQEADAIWLRARELQSGE